MKHLSTAGLALVLGTALLGGCERPPVDSVQGGFRGTGMVQVTNPRITGPLTAAQKLPAAVPQVPPGDVAAKTVFKNLQVLGDVPVGEFTRTMVSIASWVAPEKGCAYCHKEGEDLAADTLYTKKVARQMLQMTLHINRDWQSHVAQTGVTCYTCHRGQPVPAQLWFTNAGPRRAGGASADSAGQNVAALKAGLTAMAYDPLTPFLLKDQPIRATATQALPAGKGQHGRTIQATEDTYSLMMYISQSLGVNCTYCHNSRSFAEWAQSPPARVSAFHGIRMTRDLNKSYLEPLASLLPAQRRGPLGDVGKVECATCHQGLNKPLKGAPLLKDHPVLGATTTVAAAAVAVPAAAVTPVAAPTK